MEPNAFLWPPINPERARQAIEKAKRDSGSLFVQPSQFLTTAEKDAVRAWFMREGPGNSTFNSTLARIAKA